MNLISSKKGDAEFAEMITSPLIMIALGVFVLVIVLVQVNKLGSSTDYQENFYARDLALHLDSIYAVRKDVNLATTYELPTQFNTLFNSGEIKLYQDSPLTGKTFWYNQDYQYKPLNNLNIAGRTREYLHFARQGNKISISADKPKLSNNPYCEPDNKKFNLETIRSQTAFDNIEEGTELVTGDLTVYVKLTQGEPELTVYTSQHTNTIMIACTITQKLYGTLPKITEHVILPVNKKYLSADDIRRSITDSEEPALLIIIKYPEITNQVKSVIAAALQAEVNERA
ncbi:hypothetical protein COV18_03685 [Candidatus Woesearchaeota archaeon CG10_big_fil_rev_8_21_14_0_10_37_12]|nr:MAG: hypothetical protein COV18_03685 [Candidatus Woesearchaeota archaeon CG10_big_fil_rev_8_21_14_0_10_37_12]